MKLLFDPHASEELFVALSIERTCRNCECEWEVDESDCKYEFSLEFGICYVWIWSCPKCKERNWINREACDFPIPYPDYEDE